AGVEGCVAAAQGELAGSKVHVGEQQTPAAVFPSSHCSAPVIWPSPQTLARVVVVVLGLVVVVVLALVVVVVASVDVVGLVVVVVCTGGLRQHGSGGSSWTGGGGGVGGRGGDGRGRDRGRGRVSAVRD